MDMVCYVPTRDIWGYEILLIIQADIENTVIEFP